MATTKRKSTVNPAARPRAIALAVATAFLPWYLPQTAYAQTPPAPAPNTLPNVGPGHATATATVHDAAGTYLQIDQAYPARDLCRVTSRSASNGHRAT